MILMGEHDASDIVWHAVLSQKHKFLTLLIRREVERTELGFSVTANRSGTHFEAVFNVSFDTRPDPRLVAMELAHLDTQAVCRDEEGADLTKHPDGVVIEFGKSPKLQTRSDDFPHELHVDSVYACEPHLVCCGDKFKVAQANTTLTVTRADKPEGWGQNVKVKCRRRYTHIAHFNCSADTRGDQRIEVVDPTAALAYDNSSCTAIAASWNCSSLMCTREFLPIPKLKQRCQEWLSRQSSPNVSATLLDSCANRSTASLLNLTHSPAIVHGPASDAPSLANGTLATAAISNRCSVSFGGQNFHRFDFLAPL